MSRFVVFIAYFLLNICLAFRICDSTGKGKLSVKTVAKATCILQGQAQGRIALEEYTDGTTKIYGFVTNLTPGKHGFHIHHYGDLTNGCKSAGGHYNPSKHLHAAPENKKRHVGDLGNIKAGEDNWSEVYIVDKQVKLIGDHNVIGRAIVVHQLEDDLGKGMNAGSLATGNAGARVGCCIIGYAK